MLQNYSTVKEPLASLVMSLNPELIVLGPDEWLLAYLKPTFTGWIVVVDLLQGSYLLASSPLDGSGPANASCPR